MALKRGLVKLPYSVRRGVQEKRRKRAILQENCVLKRKGGD